MHRSILGNVYKAAFWTISHIVYDETLSKSIRAELLPAYREGRVDTSYLDQCPLLESLINEVLRLTVATALLRDVISPTTLRDVTIPPGSKVLVCLIFPRHLSLTKVSIINTAADNKNPGPLPSVASEPRCLGHRASCSRSSPLSK